MLFYLLLLVFCFSPTQARDVQPFWKIYNPSAPMISYRSNPSVATNQTSTEWHNHEIAANNINFEWEIAKGFAKTMIPMGIAVASRAGSRLCGNENNESIIHINGHNIAWCGGVWLNDIISLERNPKKIANAIGATAALFCLLAMSS